jgi:hypothetical protein
MNEKRIRRRSRRTAVKRPPALSFRWATEFVRATVEHEAPDAQRVRAVLHRIAAGHPRPSGGVAVQYALIQVVMPLLSWN